MNYNELKTIKKEICLEYLDHYNSIGYEILSPLPLNYKKDISLDFTTCTICSAKENISKEKKGKDYVMIQPALRNTHLDVLGKMQEDDYFFSFFSMMGGFKYYNDKEKTIDEFSNIIKHEFEFLSKHNHRVVLTIPIQYKDKLKIKEDIIEYLIDKGCELRFSDNDEKNLKWKYGIKGVEGYGTRWEISNGGDLVNWGNTINVFSNGKPFGIDFGGGVESLIYSKLKLKNSIYANDTMLDSVKEFCENGPLYEKIVDCIVSSMCIIANKENVVLRDKQVLNTYLKLLNAMMVLSDVSIEQVLLIINDINNQEIEYLNEPKMIEKFTNHFNRIIHDYSVVLNSENVDKVVKLFDICYDNKNDWINNKRITRSHYYKYFSNLSEIEFISLSKEKEERRKSNEKTKKIE